MPYDENSFLQGVAVGRSLKGVSVILANGNGRMSMYGNPAAIAGNTNRQMIPLLTTQEWEALSASEKQEYGLVAIKNAESGFDRGELVNGEDYSPPW